MDACLLVHKKFISTSITDSHRASGIYAISGSILYHDKKFIELLVDFVPNNKGVSTNRSQMEVEA